MVDAVISPRQALRSLLQIRASSLDDVRQASERRTTLARAVRDCFEESRKNKDITGKDFICKSDLEEILTPHCLESFFSGILGWDAQEQVAKHYLKVVSILIWVQWVDWHLFAAQFLGQVQLDDEALPFEPVPAVIRGCGTYIENFFRDAQYIFTPVIIKKNHDAVYAKERRLPLFTSESLGEGAYGVVTKRILAAKYMVDESEEHSTNDTNFAVACKIISSKHAITQRGNVQENRHLFIQEQRSLGYFRKSLISMTNVMSSLASFRHGDDFVILSRVADLDLEKFLTGEYDGFNDRSMHFTPFSLLQEASHLAGALHFIHSRLRLDERTVSIAHLDIKPDNILICWEESGDNDRVGRWKLHDFGISRTKSKYLANASSHHSTAFNTSIKEPRTYTAPEISNFDSNTIGIASDIWSFGCVLAVLAAFILGGPDRVGQFEKDRIVDTSGQDASYKLDNFHCPRGKQLKQSVVRFLKDLDSELMPSQPVNGRTGFFGVRRLSPRSTSTRYPVPRDSSMRQLLKSMLITDANERQNLKRGHKVMMEAVQESLDQIIRNNESILKAKLRWAIQPPFSSTPDLIDLSPTTSGSRSMMGIQYQQTNSAVSELGSITYPLTPIDTSRTVELPSHSSGSRNNSLSSQSSSQLEQAASVSINSPDKCFAASICPLCDTWVMINKTVAIFGNLTDVQGWSQSRPARLSGQTPFWYSKRCLDKYNWDMHAVAGRFLVIRAVKTGHSENLPTYTLHYLERIRGAQLWEEVNSHVHNAFSTEEAKHAIRQAVTICISVLGDLLIELDPCVIYYYHNQSLIKFPDFSHGGRIYELSFNATGSYIYCWSQSGFFIWNAATLEQLYHTSYAAPSSPTQSFGFRKLMVACANGFLAINPSGHTSVVGRFGINHFRTVHRLDFHKDIIAGASISDHGPAFEMTVALVQGSRPKSRLFIYRISEDMKIPATSREVKLQYHYTSKDAINMFLDNNRVCVIVCYAAGIIEKIYI